jgi:hypothetical protein
LTQVINQELPDYKQIRRLKIEAYAKRQEQRTDVEKENDFQQIDEFQAEWFEKRMKGNARSWERWHGMIEEWEPWNRYGEPVNIWRYHKLQ